MTTDPMDTVARCAPSAEAAERIYRVAARMAYFDGTGGMLTMPKMRPEVTIVTSCPLLLDRSYTGTWAANLSDGGFALLIGGDAVTFGPEYRDQLEAQQ